MAWFRASRYDAPIFLCYLSVVPSLAVFLVSGQKTLEDLEYLTFAAQPMAPEASAIEASSAAA